jgi:hypothetical protein
MRNQKYFKETNELIKPFIKIEGPKLFKTK